MGWRRALEIVRSGGHIAKFDDGHAEVIGPKKIVERWMGVYGSTKHSEGAECEGYLTARSVELLEQALTANAEHEPQALASRDQCSCSVWPCPTCGAVDWEDAGNKCLADWVCAADDQRQIDYEREVLTETRKEQ